MLSNKPITLYKKDSKGKIRVWKGYADGEKLHQDSGLLEGKMVTNTRVCKAKNVGRANATTASEQAIHELHRAATKKKDKGYYDTIEAAKTSRLILPMLATEIEKVNPNLKDKYYLSPKLDGMRCLIFITHNSIKLVSRENKEITTMTHLVEALRPFQQEIFEKTQSEGTYAILDGELYVHGSSFQEHMKAIKKYRPGVSEEIQFHLYDLVMKGTFEDRLEFINRFFEEYSVPQDTIVKVDQRLITSEEELDEFKKHYVTKLGYEGVMIRKADSLYLIDKRSRELLKVKDFLDISAKIVDVVPTDKRPTHGKVICVTAKGIKFAANAKLSHKEREELLRNKDEYIGKTAEIRYFEETDEGVPRFPVFVGIRLDK